MIGPPSSTFPSTTNSHLGQLTQVNNSRPRTIQPPELLPDLRTRSSAVTGPPDQVLLPNHRTRSTGQVLCCHWTTRPGVHYGLIEPGGTLKMTPYQGTPGTPDMIRYHPVTVPDQVRWSSGATGLGPVVIGPSSPRALRPEGPRPAIHCLQWEVVQRALGPSGSGSIGPMGLGTIPKWTGTWSHALRPGHMGPLGPGPGLAHLQL